MYVPLLVLPFLRHARIQSESLAALTRAKPNLYEQRTIVFLPLLLFFNKVVSAIVNKSKPNRPYTYAL